MNLWFKKILPYLVLVIFHLNSGQVDHQATTPFGSVHFTEYLPNPAYVEYNLETILIANPLAQTRETEYIGREGKWYKRLPRLFKDKQNYLPAYFVPMTPPLTPQPNCPMETPTAAKTMYTQLFGVLYITLTGIVDTMVPNSEPWSFLGQSISYIIKLAPILWWALPSGLAVSVSSQPMPLPMPGFLTWTTIVAVEYIYTQGEFRFRFEERLPGPQLTNTLFESIQGFRSAGSQIINYSGLLLSNV
ncbi:hypothetical protein DSO57_1018769 [Entomophthora muscae]|uniref:Uncharacterized protein n=1 Tax=Entomophthora muscae TaxID=34485 RepID=A0ACC2TRJ6_9FUNG|nr:hypothetical protein DSO57_1018769 [Entomophthora muscae]